MELPRSNASQQDKFDPIITYSCQTFNGLQGNFSRQNFKDGISHWRWYWTSKQMVWDLCGVIGLLSSALLQPHTSESTSFLSCLSPLALGRMCLRICVAPGSPAHKKMTSKGEEITENCNLRKRKWFSKMSSLELRQPDQSNEKVLVLSRVFLNSCGLLCSITVICPKSQILDILASSGMKHDDFLYSYGRKAVPEARFWTHSCSLHFHLFSFRTLC